MKMKILIIFLFFTGIIFISYVKSNKEEINYTIIGEKELFSSNIISKNFSDLIYDELSKKNNFGFYSKEFTYKNDILSFTASMQGVSKVVELKKQ